MRQFGKDKPEFMCFTLGNSKKVYKLPLGTSLKASEISAMYDAYKDGDKTAFDWQFGFIRKYIGDVADELTTKDVVDIIQAWQEETAHTGATVGESQALSS